MGSGRTGAARSATCASVASMASWGATAAKMCVLMRIFLMAYLRNIYISNHIPNLFFLRSIDGVELAGGSRHRRVGAGANRASRRWPKGCGAQLYFIARAPFAIICYAFQMPKLRRDKLKQAKQLDFDRGVSDL